MARKKWKRTPARLHAMRKNIKKAQEARHLASESRKEWLRQAQQPRIEHLRNEVGTEINWKELYHGESKKVVQMTEELRLLRLFVRLLERLT